MRRYRALLVAIGSAVIAAGALAAPVAAVNPRLALVNGIPGRTVDVCVGNSEVRSNLKYGGWVERFVAPGSRTVRFRRAAPGRCQGTVLAQTTLLLVDDDDKTVVGTRRVPKVVVFENLPHVATSNATINLCVLIGSPFLQHNVVPARLPYILARRLEVASFPKA